MSLNDHSYFSGGQRAVTENLDLMDDPRLGCSQTLTTLQVGEMTTLSTTTMFSATAPDRQSQLLMEERRLVQALVDVRSEMNSILPIALLPSDILEQIFFECIPRLLVHRLPDEPLPKHLIACTQVCRTWQQIALQSSSLWRVIDTCALHPNILQLFLVRSQTSPVALQSLCTGAAGDPNHTVRFTKLCSEVLRPHMHRIQSINLHESGHIHAFVPGHFDLYEHSLRHLSLSNISIHGDFRLLRGDLDISRFYSLALDGVVLVWDSIGTHQETLQLRYLSLRNMLSDTAPSLKQLHAILSTSPDLQTLALERIKFRADDTQRLKAVHLIKLRDLRLSFSRSDTIVQLLHLLLPEGADAQHGSQLFNLHIIGLPSQNIYSSTSITHVTQQYHFNQLYLKKKGFLLSSVDETAQMSFSTSQSPRELISTANFLSGRNQSTHIHSALTVGTTKPALARISEIEICRDVLSEVQQPTGLRPPWSAIVAQSMTGEPRAFEYLQQSARAMPVLLPCPIYTPILRPLLSECNNITSMIVDQNYLVDLFDLLTPIPSTEPGPTRRFLCPHLHTMTFGGKRLWSGFAEQWLVPLRNMLRTRQVLAKRATSEEVNSNLRPVTMRRLQFKRCQGVTLVIARELEDGMGVGVEITN